MSPIKDRDVSLVKQLVVATIVLYAALLVGAWWVWTVSDSNRDALCALRHEREIGVANGEKFLAEHPNGTADFSVQTIENGINTQRVTVRSLSGIACDYTPAPGRPLP